MRDYPNDADGDALRRVAADGSDMCRPMDVDFMIDVGNAECGHQIAAAAQQLGYRTKVEANDSDVEDDEDDLAGRCTVYCTKRLILTYESVITAQAQLDRISGPFGGRTDGWGTFGNAEPTDH